MKSNSFLVLFILLFFINDNVKSNEAIPNDALSFIVNGDFADPFIENVNFLNCESEIKINALFFGIFTIKNDWNEAIWNSKGYRINENNKIELVISCKDKCSSIESSEGLDGLLDFAFLHSGINYENNIILEIKSSTKRIDKALAVIKDYCPGKKSLF